MRGAFGRKVFAQPVDVIDPQGVVPWVVRANRDSRLRFMKAVYYIGNTARPIVGRPIGKNSNVLVIGSFADACAKSESNNGLHEYS
jgi:hypothetical protein